MSAQNNPYGASGVPNMSGVAEAGRGKYPNPFCDIASEYVPSDLTTIFELCEYLTLTMPPFRAVSRRVVRYFLTELVLDGGSDEDMKKYEDFLNNKLHIMQQLAEIGDDFQVYGNSFSSIYFPFDRFLICPECSMTYHIRTIKYKFDVAKSAFICDCKKCGGKRLEMKRSDRRSADVDRVKVIRWNPKDMRLRVHPVSGRIHYYLRLDAEFVGKILAGNPFYMDDTPWGMIQACVAGSKGQGEHLFRFKEDSIYHLKDSTLAGLPIKGWAIPPLFPQFKLAYYVQLLRRYDEAIALDFIIPFRVLFPSANAPTGSDPLTTTNMGQFVAHMKKMVANRRENLTEIQISPYNIGYEMLGGEAQTLAPKDSIALAVDELLNSMGFPAELYKGTLSIQAFPVALRIFEKQWNSLVDGYNDVIDWVIRRVNRHFMWGEITGSLRSVTLADDIERKTIFMQGAAGMDISKGSAYRPLGLDYLEEQRRVIEEQTEVQKLQQDAAAAQQAQQMAGGGQEEGQAGPGGTPGATPGDVYEQAGALAQQLLLQTPETMRRGELIKIKQSNPTLHALVLQRMDEMRRDMAREGQAMVMEQAKQASASDEVIGFGGLASLPSPTRIGLLVSSQIMDYSQKDMQKIAVDIGRKVPHADEAFSYIFKRLRGWE